MRAARLRCRGDLDHAAHGDQPHRSDAAGRFGQLGAGTAPTALDAPGGPNPARPPSNFYVRGVDQDGRTWIAINDREAEPALPDDNNVGPLPVTVKSVGDSDVQWRAMTVEGPNGELTTVAIDLSDVQSSVRALIWSQVGIGTVVLVVLGIVGYAVVHRSLRPLVEVERTAAAIAAGQLDRRVPERDPRTEVGRLSSALNGMLAQIQRAVASSDASAEQARTSEERMRRFITDASHELRTPLTTIRGFAELYRQGAARDVEMLMGRIESESRRMGLLVEDLLLLARPRRAAAAGSASGRSADPGHRRRARHAVDRP